MPSVILTYDNTDAGLGPYFNRCYLDLQPFLDALQQSAIIALNGVSCTVEVIERHLDDLNGQPFIFIGISHGRSNALVASQHEYISYANAHRFQNSLFYTYACLTALELGPELERIGCRGYLGYSSEVKTNVRFEDIFIKCKNAGIVYFLAGNRTLQETYDFMLANYEKEAKDLSEKDGSAFIAAAFLEGNAKALTMLGNRQLTLNDLTMNG